LSCSISDSLDFTRSTTSDQMSRLPHGLKKEGTGKRRTHLILISRKKNLGGSVLFLSSRAGSFDFHSQPERGGREESCRRQGKTDLSNLLTARRRGNNGYLKEKKEKDVGPLRGLGVSLQRFRTAGSGSAKAARGKKKKEGGGNFGSPRGREELPIDLSQCSREGISSIFQPRAGKKDKSALTPGK